MQSLPGLGCSMYGTRKGDDRLGSITINSTLNRFAVSNCIPLYVISVCFTIHDIMCATLYIVQLFSRCATQVLTQVNVLTVLVLSPILYVQSTVL